MQKLFSWNYCALGYAFTIVNYARSRYRQSVGSLCFSLLLLFFLSQNTYPDISAASKHFNVLWF